MEKSERVKKCNQIMELWREGYTDIEIRKRIHLEPEEFTKCLQLIKKDNLLATEAMLLFEKEVIKLHDIFQKTLAFAETCDPKYYVSAMKLCADISEKKITIAQKLNAIDPQRFVLEVHEEQRMDYRKMSLEDLLAHNQAQRAKYNPQ